MSRAILFTIVLAGWIPVSPAAGSGTDDVTADLAAILKVGPEGAGNEAAATAWNHLTSKLPPAALPSLLDAMETANPLARNWLRTAAEVVLEHGRDHGQPPPVAELKAYLQDPGRGPAGRVTAFELLREWSEPVWNTLVPGLLHDPVPALRREPVARLLATGKETKNKAGLREALQAAREEDQVREAAALLRELGETVDLPRHFGFLMDWKVAGPFANKEPGGFEQSHPPETTLDFSASMPGKELAGGKPAEVRWQEFTSRDEYGMIDFNKPLGMVKEATAYAVTTYDSPEAREAEIRIGSKNAWKVWLNGEPLFGREEYHRGTRIDHYVVPVKLRKGENTILVKCGQNGQTETWTVEWEFQLRICDRGGTAILDPGRKPTPPEALRGRDKSNG